MTTQLIEAAKQALLVLESGLLVQHGSQVLNDLREALAAAEQPAEPVAFNHDIGADRFKVVKGSYWWHIRIGDSTGNVGKFHTKLAAEDMALKLLTAFRDGAYMQFHASPAAPVQESKP